MKKLKGFTLVETVVVLVIFGILVGLMIAQYQKAIENQVYSEAKTNLAMLRRLQLAYYDQYGVYTDVIGTQNPFAVSLPIVPSDSDPLGAATCTDSGFYFQYDCWATGPRCIAFRCVSGGKSPQGRYIGDRMRLYFNGTLERYQNLTGTWERLQ